MLCSVRLMGDEAELEKLCHCLGCHLQGIYVRSCGRAATHYLQQQWQHDKGTSRREVLLYAGCNLCLQHLLLTFVQIMISGVPFEPTCAS